MNLIKLVTTNHQTYLFEDFTTPYEKKQGILGGNFVRLSIPKGNRFSFQKGVKLVKERNCIEKSLPSDKEKEFYHLISEKGTLPYSKKVVEEFELGDYVKIEQ